MLRRIRLREPQARDFVSRISHTRRYPSSPKLTSEAVRDILRTGK